MPKLSEIYNGDTCFELEKAKIYEKYWIYYCQASYLEKEGDTFSRDVCGNPLSVRRSKQGLIAFENICAHRKSTIFFEEVSNRPFVCKYHGWVYDENAELSKIPNSQIYSFNQQQVKECGKLKKYSVQAVGNLIFVNLSSTPIPIGEQFSLTFLGELTESSNHFDDAVVSTSWVGKYNWKLIFENVMDWNHVRFVHPSSFAPLQVKSENNVDKSQAWIEGNVKKNDPFLNQIDLRELSYSTKSNVNLPDRWFRKHIQRYRNEDLYYNWFIFPNVNYCSIGGDHFLIQQFDPVGPSEISYRLEIVTAKRNEKVNFVPLLTALIEGEKKVIDEDTIFLTSQQNNISKSSQTSFFQGVNETPLLNFRNWLNKNIYEKL
jgi:phenylpropionate dioxygenase-like ring-hydroxylating dioxygenase large terminal subunit